MALNSLNAPLLPAIIGTAHEAATYRHAAGKRAAGEAPSAYVDAMRLRFSSSRRSLARQAAALFSTVVTSADCRDCVRAGCWRSRARRRQAPEGWRGQYGIK